MVDHQQKTTAPATAPDWSDLTRPVARLVFPARHVGIVVAAALIAVLPSLGPDRWMIAVACLAVLLPVDLAMHSRTRATGRFPAFMPYLNQVSACAVVLVAPRFLPAAVVVLLADDALTAFVFGRRTALLAGLFGAALMGVVAVSRADDVTDPWPTVAALGLSAVTCAAVLGGLADAERRLRARYHALVSEVDVIVWELVPGSDRFSYVSSGARDLLGYPLADWYAPGFWTDHLHPDDADRVLTDLDEALAAGIDHILEYRMVHAAGHEVHMRDVATVEVDAAGRVVNMRGVMMDISDVRRAEELLRERATHDILTGLPNRGLLADRVDRALKESGRTGDPVALLLLDLDEFKQVNDALGHEAGDRLLIAFADRLRAELRDCDTIARLGGDEFAVLLTVDADVEGAVAVGRRVLRALEAPFVLDGLDLHTGASIGVALFPDHAADAIDLQSRADVAMYLAKRSGRGVALYEPGLDRAGMRRITLLGELRQAMADDQLALEYQPCFDLRTGELASVEALLRWDHPDQGRVGPSDFIRLAEMSGLIEPLTRLVVERAVAARGRARLEVPMAVNVSVRNLSEHDLVPWLARVVADAGLAPGDLILELTESAVMADVESAARSLAQIRDLGIHIALDDFGTGQSTLAYLRHLPADELKIDRVFVDGIGADPTDAAICATVVALAHQLGLRVVAEGAVDGADIAELRRIGCDMVQGFFLGLPVPEADLGSLRDRVIDLPGSSRVSSS